MLTSHPQIKLLCFNESSEAFLELGDYDAAQQSVTKALSIDPANTTALHLREQIGNKTGGGS